MTRTRALAGALALALTVVVLPGCGGGLSEVSGTVKMDGKPLPEGEIIFEAADGKATPAGGPIKDGRYAVQVAPGAKKVKITASRPTAKPDPVMKEAARESMIRPEFNERTTLKADVRPGRQDGLDFDVKSIKRKR